MQKSTVLMDKSTMEAKNMPSRAYYRDVNDTACDIQSDDIPLQLNCTGRVDAVKPLAQYNPTGRQDFYLQYVTDGWLQMESFGETRRFAEGMFIVYSPRTPYRYRLLPGERIGYDWVHFTGYHAARLLQGLGLETNQCYKIDENQARKGRISDSFGRLFDEFVTRRPGFDEICAAQLTEILVELTRGADCIAVGPMRRLASLAFLHGHYTESTPIAELAEMEHLSESRYREVFRAQTGYSPGDYRTALRLQRACDLLTLTDLAIGEIAVECGYADVLYFSRVFKQKKRVTPGEYRRVSRGRGE